MEDRLPQNYIPVHYDLYMHIVENQYPFDAIVTITFQKQQTNTKLYLNIDPSIQIKRIMQNNIDLKYKIDYPKLIIKRSKNIKMDFDSYPITIEYQVTPNQGYNQGFFICNGNYFTDFEPRGARKLLPCFDEPCIRSSFSVRLLIPSHLTAISNMSVKSIQSIENEKEVSFYQTPRMCSYLLCICIGHFSSIIGSTKSGTIVEFFASTGREKLLYKYLDIAIFTLNWLENKFGVKYELPRLQLLSTYGFPGGMENYGLITLNDFTYSQRHLFHTTLVMHEITHQWFGDLVSIKYWDSLWLNEGFAEFIQFLILNDYNKELDAFHLFAKNESVSCLQYYNEGLIVPEESKVNFVTLFHNLVYAKGAFVVKMFYDLVGEKSFYEICSNYLNEFKNRSVEVNDFISIANSTMKKDFNSFFNPWLRNVGFPVLIVNEIEENCKKVGITISQKCHNNCTFLLSVPIMYEKDEKIYKKKVEINDKCVKIELNFNWVIVNDDLSSLCFVIYSKSLLKSLQKANNENKISKLNKVLIKQSVKIDDFSHFLDDEIINMASTFKN
ncbi:hypothetical protein M9Y10_006820 [Tritrichomonas musculus]|uniref:Uncharacterized protein n=1 Tax=Tritrichomonas musculus TaxID=1915356 RepID=A0ABR2JG27_9EUKA